MVLRFLNLSYICEPLCVNNKRLRNNCSIKLLLNCSCGAFETSKSLYQHLYHNIPKYDDKHKKFQQCVFMIINSQTLLPVIFLF